MTSPLRRRSARSPAPSVVGASQCTSPPAMSQILSLGSPARQSCSSASKSRGRSRPPRNSRSSSPRPANNGVRASAGCGAIGASKAGDDGDVKEHPCRRGRSGCTLRGMGALEAEAAAAELEPEEPAKPLRLFSGRANPELAAKMAAHLGADLGEVTLRTFSAGETYCRYEESIRGSDVFIVQPTCANPVTGVVTNDALMELLVMIDAAVGASANRVVAVMPWFAYSRQDKKSAHREPISARLVAHMLEAAGADRVLAMDLHAGQVQGFFTKPVDHMTALPALANHFADMEIQDLVVVAPDVGRVKLNHKFADKIGAELALMTKQRPAQQVAQIGYVIGDVAGKTA